MSQGTTLDILKNAILLERRGRAYYRKVAEQAENTAVKQFFEFMAEEEAQHISILADQYKSFKSEGQVRAISGETHPSHDAARVLTEQIKSQIAAAGFEAAAVSAAMAMEERAIRMYAQRAQDATDSHEKALFAWLADWEKEHLEMLAGIDRELTETVWNDNSFWPM